MGRAPQKVDWAEVLSTVQENRSIMFPWRGRQYPDLSPLLAEIGDMAEDDVCGFLIPSIAKIEAEALRR